MTMGIVGRLGARLLFSLSCSTVRTMSSSTTEALFWRAEDSRPAELSVDPRSCAAIPRCSAWITVDDDHVALLEGYNVASHIPPTLMVSSMKFPPAMMNKLKEHKQCTLSVATVREKHCLGRAACADGDRPTAWSLDEMGLTAYRDKRDRPPAVQSSPVHMYCRLVNVVTLTTNIELVLLEAETIVIRKEILSEPTEKLKSGGRNLYAKIDAHLMQPVASLGNGRFVRMDQLYSMERPRKASSAISSNWESDPFATISSSDGPGRFEDVEYTYHNDTSGLGYNPMKAIVLPRPIGWIGTYRDVDRVTRVSHVAPYSFFTDLGGPLLAFSSYRRNFTDGNESKKDAQLDTETSGCFSANVVTKDLSVRMNFTSAPLTRDDSEFEASPELRQQPATCIDAPIVQDCPIVSECRHLKTVDAASFSIVVGEIVGMRIDKRVLTQDGEIDPSTLLPVTRLGYTDEYGVASQLLSVNGECSTSSLPAVL